MAFSIGTCAHVAHMEATNGSGPIATRSPIIAYGRAASGLRDPGNFLLPGAISRSVVAGFKFPESCDVIWLGRFTGAGSVLRLALPPPALRRGVGTVALRCGCCRVPCSG